MLYTFGESGFLPKFLKTGKNYDKISIFLDWFRKRGTMIPPHFHDYCKLVYYLGDKGNSGYRQNDATPYKLGEILVPYERAFSSDKHFRFEDNYVKFISTTMI